MVSLKAAERALRKVERWEIARAVLLVAYWAAC
jgi:hypothetical protein